ncbi:unnamed protein product [Mycena citricolor]|uniref:Uncharacterized protein n=1 Tax=Mycena citricolor TaxID=2018698 RepID=A0AAD2HAV3_9AGAR|nr:unnamed protein product [Mycena citricolor]
MIPGFTTTYSKPSAADKMIGTAQKVFVVAGLVGHILTHSMSARRLRSQKNREMEEKGQIRASEGKAAAASIH